MRNQKTSRVFQLGWEGDPAEKNDEITLYDEPVKEDETTAGTESNECQLNDGRSSTSNRGETSESERTLNDGGNVNLTNGPRRQRRPSGYLQDFRINQAKTTDLSASTISTVEPTTAKQGSGRLSASAAAAVEPKVAKPEVGRPSVSTISTVEPMTVKQGRGRLTASASSNVEPRAAKPEVGRSSASTISTVEPTAAKPDISSSSIQIIYLQLKEVR